MQKQFAAKLKIENYQQQIAAGTLKQPVVKRSEMATALGKMSPLDQELIRLGLYQVED